MTGATICRASARASSTRGWSSLRWGMLKYLLCQIHKIWRSYPGCTKGATTMNSLFWHKLVHSSNTILWVPKSIVYLLKDLRGLLVVKVFIRLYLVLSEILFLVIIFIQITQIRIIVRV